MKLAKELGHFLQVLHNVSRDDICVSKKARRNDNVRLIHFDNAKLIHQRV